MNDDLLPVIFENVPVATDQLDGWAAAPCHQP